MRLQGLNSSHLDNTSDATIQYLGDLDWPYFKGIDEERLGGLKHLINASQKLLWVTSGPEAEHHFQSMSKGFLACILYENPRSRFRHLNIVDPDAINTTIVSTTLLRLVNTDLDNDYGLAAAVWNSESELRYRNGMMEVSRITPTTPRNKRYVSSRRPVSEQVNVRKSNVRVIESSNTYELALGNTQPEEPEEEIPRTRIWVDYSTLSALRVEGVGFLHYPSRIPLSSPPHHAGAGFCPAIS